MSDPKPPGSSKDAGLSSKVTDLASEIARLDRSVVLERSTTPEGDLLRTLLAILPVGVVAYDTEKVHYANAAGQNLLGVHPDAASVGDIFRYIDPADWPLVEARRAARIRGERTPLVELRMVHQDGRRLHVTVETIDLRAPPNPMFLTIIQDVTERRKSEEAHKAEEERRQRESEALLETQKLESLGVLTGGIAHDFNNLLANVYASLAALSLLTEALPEDQRRPFLPHLANAEGAAARAAELTRQLLAYGGGAPLERLPTSLTAVVRELTGLLRVPLSKKLSLRFELAEHLPPVFADPSQLKQIVMNLVTNAAEAIGDTEGTITVRTHTTADVGPEYRPLVGQPKRADPPPFGWSVLEVRDDGPGMSAETRAHVFEPFFSTKGLGRGLGLATTVGILRTHEARLALDTEPGAGALFSLAFPALPPTAVVPPPRTSRGTPPPDLARDGLRGTVLLVDDEPRARFALGFLLKSRGFTLIEAANGVEALETVAAGPVDVVVMDLSMPKMGGREAFLEMRSRWPGLPVILTSGYSAEHLASLPHREEVFAFLEKPFREEKLIPLLVKACRNKG